MGPSSFFRIVGFSKWFPIFSGRYARQQVCRRILGCFVLVVVVKDPFKFCSSVTMIVFYFGTGLIYWIFVWFISDGIGLMSVCRRYWWSGRMLIFNRVRVSRTLFGLTMEPIIVFLCKICLLNSLKKHEGGLGVGFSHTVIVTCFDMIHFVLIVHCWVCHLLHIFSYLLSIFPLVHYIFLAIFVW